MKTPNPCRRCGYCCSVPGYVRLRPADVERLAGALGMPVPEFTASCTRLTADRRGLSLVERPDGRCPFLTAARLCAVYEARPAQCRGFPARWRFPGYERHCAAAREGVRERVDDAGKKDRLTTTDDDGTRFPLVVKSSLPSRPGTRVGEYAT